VAIRERASPPDVAALVRSQAQLAEVLRIRADYRREGIILERAQALADSALGPDDPATAEVVLCAARWRYAVGDFAGASDRAQRAVAIRERALGPRHLEVADALQVLGASLYRQNRIADTRAAYERSLAIREERLPEGHPGLGVGYNGLALVEGALGNYAEARRLYERGAAIIERNAGPDSPQLAGSLMNIGLMIKNSGDPAAALPYYQRAIAIHEATLGPDSPEVARVLVSLAEAQRSLGDFAAARATMERTLRIREETLGPDHPDVAIILHNLGLLLRQTGDPQGARPLLERAVRIFEKTQGSDDPTTAQVRGNLGVVLAHCGDVDGALAAAVESERVAREHLRLTARRIPEREALRYAEILQGARELALSLAAAGRLERPDQVRTAWNVLLRSRAVVLEEIAEQRRRLRAAHDPTLAALDSALAATSERMARVMLNGPGKQPERYAARLDSARRERERVEREIAAHDAELTGLETGGQAGLDAVAAALPESTALVAYARFPYHDLNPPTGARGDTVRISGSKQPPRYVAFVLPGAGRDPRVAPLGSADEIDSLARRFLEEAGRGTLRRGRTASDAERDCRAAGSALRARAWDPVVAALGGARRVLLVPDGMLHFVPFAALPAADGAFLVETGPTLHLMGSERDAIDRRAAPSSTGLLALGGPAFDARSGETRVPGTTATDAVAVAVRGAAPSCEAFDRVRFAPLPGALAEVEDVVRVWRSAPGAGGGSEGGAIALEGVAASETAFKRLAPGRRVLHLATHGFFLGEDCARTASGTRGIGGMARREGAAPAEEAAHSRLALFGLAFAGANRRAEARPGDDDGVLTAEEASTMHLAGAEWVVLSACETGLGEVAGTEGVLGLQRAFQVAGARTTILSLWQVDDESTRRWMSALYRLRMEGRRSTAEAVRGAALEVLRERRAQGLGSHPFHWAGFVAVGDWR